MSEEPTHDDPRSRWATVVPAFDIHSTKNGASKLRSGLGISSSRITCAPEPTDTEPSRGIWSTTGARLEAVIDDAARGPRSGVTSEYKDTTIAVGRQALMVSTDALLGVLDGRSAWGPSGERAGRLLVWRWSYDDIDEIRACRIKKMFKLWDAELVVRCNEPKATLRWTSLGDAADVLITYDAVAKSAKRDGSNVLGLAHTLAEAVARSTGRTVQHQRSGTKDLDDVFRFA